MLRPRLITSLLVDENMHLVPLEFVTIQEAIDYSMDGDTTQYDNSYVEFLQNNLSEPNYKPRGKKKVVKDTKPVGVEKYFNSNKD